MLALLAALCHPPSLAGSTSGLLPITGELRVASCAAYPCPRPAAEDARWSTLALGPEGIDSSLNQEEGLAWVSVRFTLPPGALPERPTLLITHPADAEEAFLNGEPVGGKGRISRRFSAAIAGPRILPLPAGALREGANEISFFSLLAGRNARFYTGRFLLGEQIDIEAEGARLLFPTIATEAAFFSMFIIVFVFYGFLVVKRVVRSEYLFFMAFIALHAAAFFLGSAFLHRNQVMGAEYVYAQAVLGSVRTLTMIGLVTHVSGSRFGPVFWLCVVGAGCFLVFDLLLPPLTALTALTAPRKVLLLLLGVYYLVVSADAVRRKREDAVPILVGVVLYVVGSRLDLFWGIAVRDYAIAAFSLCMLFALTSRHARLRSRIEEISTRLLDAHEVERRRIARDIHDGVGQSLLALRLKLQKLAVAMGGGAVPSAPLTALAADTEVILEEVRRLSMDLRPSFVESMSLRDLLQWYGSSFAEARGLDFRIRDGGGRVPDPGPRIKDNLYRIFQEVLTNVGKHAAAARVEVSMRSEGRRLVLEVSDDGRGFAIGDGAAGIGLETMRERAELIGGSCRFESVPGRGTRVRVEVEVP